MFALSHHKAEAQSARQERRVAGMVVCGGQGRIAAIQAPKHANPCDPGRPAIV